jgi:hypothetical protein
MTTPKILPGGPSATVTKMISAVTPKHFEPSLQKLPIVCFEYTGIAT